MKKKIEKPTHFISANDKKGTYTSSHAYGKSDLYTLLRHLMKDGYLYFTIQTL